MAINLLLRRLKIILRFNLHIGKNFALKGIDEFMLSKIFHIFILLSILHGQGQNLESSSNSSLSLPFSNDRYVSNSDGSMMMKVNVWGQVVTPGVHLIYDGTDFASLISIVGGPKEGANFKKLRLYREFPDKEGQVVYNINFQDFILTGDRSNFIKIKPNDTIIVPQKFSFLFLKQVGTVNTLFSAIMIYLQIKYFANN